MPIQILDPRGWAVNARRATVNVNRAEIAHQHTNKYLMNLDYAYPTMMAEKALKDLHNAMLENRYDDALLAGLNAIVDVRLALVAIKDTAERKQ